MFPREVANSRWHYKHRLRICIATATFLACTLAACSNNPREVADPTILEGAGSTSATDLFPDVIDATATQADDGTWTIAATLSSPYDSPERYADGWRVIGPDGTEFGQRLLTHDHADEQPFTRTHSGVVIPPDIDVVTIQGRDQISGWGGLTFEVALQR